MIDLELQWHLPYVNAPKRSASPLALALAAGLLSLTACEGETVDLGNTSSLAGNKGGDAEEEGDPTGQSCEVPGESESCQSGAVAYCDRMAGELEFGPCLEEPECEPGETKLAYSDEECGNIYDRCVLYGGVPDWEREECDTPLVLRFDDQPVQMVAAPSATFDISMAGGCIDHDWPTAHTPWLARDLDGNGMIDGGNELFGSGTSLGQGGRARNGFGALAELDENGDRRVDAQDAAFGELLVWRDYDGDKLSGPGELEPVANVGLEEIELDFHNRRVCDDRGNCGVQRSAFSFSRGGIRRTGEVVDVYLACH